MKVQIATLALSERGYMLFKVHLHDDLRLSLEQQGLDQKDYLRDRVSRCSYKQFRRTSWFFFVMEDRDKDGHHTRPHAHGCIEVPRARLPAKGEKHHLHFQRLAKHKGLEFAELLHGQMLTKAVIRSASGNTKGDRPRVVSGLDQSRNLWTSTPKRPFLNHHWVTYAFKNTKGFSQILGDRRLAFSMSLRTEARKVWDLIRDGEAAMSHWT